MRTKRFQNRITAGRFTLPTAILISVSCWILTAVLLPETETQQSGYSFGKHSATSASPPGKPSLQLYSVCRHRVLPDTAQQYVRHHPDAGIGTDFCLLPADIRLPQPAHAVCGRLGSRLLPGGTVFPLQELPAGTAHRQSLPRLCLHRTGQPAFSAAHAVCPHLLDRCLQLPVSPTQKFLRLLGRMERTLLAVAGTRPLLRANGTLLPAFRELVTFAPIRFDYQPWELATLGYLLVLFIVSAAHCLIAGYEDKIRTRSYLHFLILLNFCIFVYIGLQPALSVHLMSFLLIGVSILAGHLFVLTNSRSSNIFFICAFIGLFILLGFNIWTLL